MLQRMLPLNTRMSSRPNYEVTQNETSHSSTHHPAKYVNYKYIISIEDFLILINSLCLILP